MPIQPNSLADKLSRMDIFQSIPAPILLNLAQQCRIEEFPAGAAVFLKGEPGRALYIILDGAARVHDGDYTVALMNAGHCFGEMALLDEGPRSMSVSATEASHLARIDREVFFEVLGDHPDVMQKIVSLLTGRLRNQTDKTLEQLRRREEELSQLVAERTAELMQQKEEAEQQRLRAEQSERAEQQFLANMSHEIRTPMNAVMGMTNLLLQKNPRQDQLMYLHSIKQSSEALLVILNDILDISKIQAGKLELEFTGLSIPAILEQVRATLQFRAEEKGLSLAVECDPAIPPVLIGDPVRLQQVLLNLVGNAVKFTEKGQVSLKARLLNSGDKTCLLHVEVADTGIGMSSEQLAFVFEPFRQATSDTTRKYGGTGLGLTISKQLVDKFGGTLEAASSPGHGSKFWFDIELAIGAEQDKTETTLASDAAEALRGLRILVAEDNPFNQIVAIETLELLIPDATVVATENGRETVERVRAEAFDVVLMDVTMPVMDGLEATRAIRRLPAPTRNIPIIAFTASVTKKEIRRCLDAGMDAYVPKPFKDAELIGALLSVSSPREIPAQEKKAAAPLSGPNPPAFLEQLAGGNQSRIRKYLELYLESARAGLPRIEAALAGADREELRRVVHTMKPQFRLLGLEEMAELAQEIETQILEGRAPETLPEKVERLTAEVRNSLSIFESRLTQ